MKLYGHPDSAHALKVKFCLDQAGIEHDYEVVDIFADIASRQPEFIEKSRFCEVPLLVDGTQNLIQSNAILVYLARNYQILGGEDEHVLQSCVEWLVWEANKIGMCLPQLRANKLFAGFELKADARAWLLARYEHDIEVLENELGDDRPYLLGEQLTIADFSLCGYLMLADDAEVDVPRLVCQWLDRLRNLEAWKSPAHMLGQNTKQT